MLQFQFVWEKEWTKKSLKGRLQMAFFFYPGPRGFSFVFLNEIKENLLVSDTFVYGDLTSIYGVSNILPID